MDIQTRVGLGFLWVRRRLFSDPPWFSSLDPDLDTVIFYENRESPVRSDICEGPRTFYELRRKDDCFVVDVTGVNHIMK